MNTPVRALAIVFLVVRVVVIYKVGLRGPFLFDDYPNIIRNPLVAIGDSSFDSLRDAAFSGSEGLYPERGLARLSFALNYYVVGQYFDAFTFKLTNLLIHIVNGLLVYLLAGALLSRYQSRVAVPAGTGSVPVARLPPFRWSLPVAG